MTEMWCHRINAACLLLLLGLLTGCQRGETLGKVTGRVTVGGVPLYPGLIIFSNQAKGVHITSELKPDGAYELQTARGLGLPLGTYQVAVSPPIPVPPMPGMPPPVALGKNVAIPPKYLQPSSSGVQLEVVDGTNVLDVVIP